MATLLITGATGHVGSELVKLLAGGEHTVRAFVRERNEAPLPSKVEEFVGDLGKPDTLRAALEGVDRLYLIDVSHGPYTKNIVAAAKANGVQHIVFQSSIGVGLDPMPLMGKWHHDCEAIIKESGIEWTFLRPNSFMSNSLMWAPSIKAENVVRDPIGPGTISIIDPADIAAVAATALTEEGHAGNIYTITGKESLTTEQQVHTLAKALNRTIAYVPITKDEAAKAMQTMGLDDTTIGAIGEINDVLGASQCSFITETVADITGRQPRTFEQWCEQHVEAFQ